MNVHNHGAYSNTYNETDTDANAIAAQLEAYIIVNT
jgi:hypothetical protein